MHLPQDPELAELDRLRAALERLRDSTEHPGVATALQHAVWYTHLAGTFLGDDRLDPLIDPLNDQADDQAADAPPADRTAQP